MACVSTKRIKNVFTTDMRNLRKSVVVEKGSKNVLPVRARFLAPNGKKGDVRQRLYQVILNWFKDYGQAMGRSDEDLLRGKNRIRKK